MLIAQISDTHILAPDSDHPAAQLRADCLARVVADVNAQAPDLVIFTGDTVQHGTLEEYARLSALLEPLDAPLYLIPGNRDDKRQLRGSFPDLAYLPEDGEFLHYSVDVEALRLVGIDSTAAEERKGRFCERRQAWLEATLGEQPARPTLLFIHHPPFDVGDHYIGGYRDAQEAAALADIVSRHAQVAGLLCGHVHWLIEREWAGTQARIMPSVAVDVRKGIDETEAQQRPIYWLHTLDAERGLRSTPRMTA